MSIRSLAFRQSVITVTNIFRLLTLPTRWRQKSTGIVMNKITSLSQILLLTYLLTQRTEHTDQLLAILRTCHLPLSELIATEQAQTANTVVVIICFRCLKNTMRACIQVHRVTAT